LCSSTTSKASGRRRLDEEGREDQGDPGSARHRVAAEPRPPSPPGSISSRPRRRRGTWSQTATTCLSTTTGVRSWTLCRRGLHAAPEVRSKGDQFALRGPWKNGFIGIRPGSGVGAARDRWL
jgi:hypothetical protein